jgi:hypothetical protein
VEADREERHLELQIDDRALAVATHAMDHRHALRIAIDLADDAPDVRHGPVDARLRRRSARAAFVVDVHLEVGGSHSIKTCRRRAPIRQAA